MYVCTLLQGASLTRSLSLALALFLTHTRSRVDTFLFRIHFQCTHTTVHAWVTLLQHAMLHSVTSFLTFAGLLFYWGRGEAFLFCSFLSYVTSYVNCQATNTRTHTHMHRQQRQRSRRQASPILAHKAFRAVSCLLSLSFALSRCVFSLSSLKVKEEGCRCRCRSRRWQRAASSDRRSRLQLSQRTKLSDHCIVGRWILRLQRWAVLQELISIIKTVNTSYILWIYWIIF